MLKVYCNHCQKINEFNYALIGRRDECQFCKSDLHACKNCQFYDVKSYNECRENSAEPVKVKDRANFCDFYLPRGDGEIIDLKAKQKAMAEALFKK